MSNTINIIAEIGVNWDTDIGLNGIFNTCLDMIVSAKIAGADAIKLQMYNEENINIIKDNSIKIRLQKMLLTPELIRSFYDFTKEIGLDFILTPMYPGAFNILRGIKVRLDYIKIRYADRFNHEIAEEAVKYAKEFDVPIIISCDLTKAVYANEYHCEDLHTIAMYCIPKYPATVRDIDFSYDNLGSFSGYSNHVPNKFIPIIAIARGIEFIEVHVMSSNKCIDYQVSLTFNDLKEICKFRDDYQSTCLNED